MNVYSSFIHNHPKLETTGKSSTGERINEKLAYPYSGYYSAIERKPTDSRNLRSLTPSKSSTPVV